MTSIHFAVHPLPGTEDQLNDRYVAFLLREENLSHCLIAMDDDSFVVAFEFENMCIFRLLCWHLFTF